MIVGWHRKQQFSVAGYKETEIPFSSLKTFILIVGNPVLCIKLNIYFRPCFYDIDLDMETEEVYGLF